MNVEQGHARLVDALLAWSDDPGHTSSLDTLVGLYETSSTFQRAVDQLVAMLPAMTEGLARAAKDADRMIESEVERITAAPAAPLLYLLKEGEA